MRGYALFGGSFNPPHIGHLRLALEIAEQCQDRIERVVFIPCAHPPHKEEGSLLPFAWRCTMLEAACAPFPALGVSRIEGEREERSYTWDTLVRLRDSTSAPFFFLLGSDDYIQLATWYRGLELPRLTNFLIVPRGAFSPADFSRETKTLWPYATIEATRALLPGGGMAQYQPIPLLEVSATDIRRRFVLGQSLAFLVPDAVARFLSTERTNVLRIWEAQ